MGWFLSKNAGKKKPKKTAKTAKAAKPWDPRRTLAGLQVLLACGLVGGTVLGWKRLEDGLSGYAKEHQVLPREVDQVVLVDMPLWMTPKLQRDMRAIVAVEISGNPLDNTGLQNAVRSLAANPWVKQVDHVRRLTDGTVEVNATFREPVAKVETSDGYILVDIEGVRLPVQYTPAEARRLVLPALVGVKTPPAREGKPWPSEELQAGLKLVKLLQAEPYLSQVEAFDVSERDPRGRIRLKLLTRNGMVRWGLPPGEEKSIETDAKTKKTWLAQIYKSRGLIDAGGKVVDVYGGAVFIHEPALAEEQAGMADDLEGNVAYGYNGR